ncbi:hypothetical protein CVT24_006542 [Panaeolus cyanescens]|uniref:Uncharacterized protein n=1 Tax=Panaeolus cyanescens TaxID=181874 RepID=A0A409YXB2_9AGAR|nr:hypothetical protein CVT24_006542 [Panaeolus cyanescens]
MSAPSRLVYNFGQFQFSYRNDSGAAESLYYFHVLSTNNDLNTSAQWGHDTFVTPTYLNTIHASCLWIRRYITSAAVLSRKAAASPTASGSVPLSPCVRNAIREVIRVIQIEEYQHSDPVTNFLKTVYGDSTLTRRRRSLGGQWRSAETTSFCKSTRIRFCTMRGISSARLIAGSIGEWILLICQRGLNLSPEEGENWIVNLIRETRMCADANIDLEKNIIPISSPPLPVYQSVLEKTRQLAVRTQAFGVAISY